MEGLSVDEKAEALGAMLNSPVWKVFPDGKVVDVIKNGEKFEPRDDSENEEN